jgi:hypothetical protein
VASFFGLKIAAPKVGSLVDLVLQLAQIVDHARATLF